MFKNIVVSTYSIYNQQSWFVTVFSPARTVPGQIEGSGRGYLVFQGNTPQVLLT